MTEKEFLKFNPGVNKANMYCNHRMFFELVSIDDIDIKKSLDLSEVVVFQDYYLSENVNRTPMFNAENKKFHFEYEGISETIKDMDKHSKNGILNMPQYTDGQYATDHPTSESIILGLRRIKNLKYVKDNAVVQYNIFKRQGINSKFCIILGHMDKNGVWIGNMGISTLMSGGGSPHKVDNGLLNNLSSIFEENSSIVDFGCGNADYIRNLISEGFECEAYDGNPNTPEMTGDLGKVLDLSKKFDLNKKFDYVISIEVAEHIPKEYEEIYVDNLIRHTEYYLITSWAVKGQGGDGHVNEQDEDYVLNLYKEKGMVYQKEISEALRSVATLGWFKKTIYVFGKE